MDQAKFKEVGSSNINEVIRAVLLGLFIFLQKDFARTKSTKNTKTQISDFFPLRCFFMRVKTLPFLFFVCLYAFLCLIKI